MPNVDAAFSGDVAQFYDHYLAGMFFPQSDALVARLADLASGALLEIAADAAFDAVACQFGVMFYPDRVRGHAEAHRVLQPGGRYLFSVWDAIETNPACETAAQTDVVEAAWEVPDVANAAIAMCQGTPLRAEIEARDPGGVQRATEAVAQALIERFGPGAQRLPTQALLIEARS
jgi:SAM-dependent methyltransferase